MKEQKSRKKGLLVGYARVSTLDQDPQLQIDALLDAGVLLEIHEEWITGKMYLDMTLSKEEEDRFTIELKENQAV